ncbi:hypothetical protein WJT86_00785 [Microvirga sp. W0021]|uniref:Uncharacterized protein n=1 Tax=Hohaiivirga grylli TaxID=3133970 RepID=A0ABV0BF38_9HYPH
MRLNRTTFMEDLGRFFFITGITYAFIWWFGLVHSPTGQCPHDKSIGSIEQVFSGCRVAPKDTRSHLF